MDSRDASDIRIDGRYPRNGQGHNSGYRHCEKRMKKINLKFSWFAVFFVIIIGAACALWKGPLWSTGFFAAAIWSIVNFILTMGLLDIAMLKRSRERAWLYLIIKFPVLYLAGFAILAGRVFPLTGILSGLLVTTVSIGVFKLWPKRA